MSLSSVLTSIYTRIGLWIGVAPPCEPSTEPVPQPAAVEPVQVAAPAPEPPRFHGYPYLITLFSPGVFHLMVLPSDWPDEALIDLARAQVAANRLKACVALGPDRSVFVNLEGRLTVWPKVPASFIVECGALLPPVPFDQTTDLATREDRLRRFVEHLQERHGSGYGDEVRDSIAASSDARARLEGSNEDGSPRGLVPCPVCGEARGECLEQIATVEPRVMTVHCRCDNNNRCARCGEHLFERRLDANYYSASTGLILHVPGGYARRHVCAAGEERLRAAS